MTITSATIIEPVAISRRDSSAVYAEGWLVGCVFSLGFASFCLTNFLLRIFSSMVERGWPGGWRRVRWVVIAGFVGASRCAFYCYFSINKLHSHCTIAMFIGGCSTH